MNNRVRGRERNEEKGPRGNEGLLKKRAMWERSALSNKADTMRKLEPRGHERNGSKMKWHGGTGFLFLDL